MKNKLVLLVVSTLILSSSTKAVGTGSFFPHPTTPFFGGGESHSVALGDLDGDGDLDAVVANAWDEAETVWVNDGAGWFTAHPSTPAFGAGLGSSIDVALGDLDGDGDLDAVVANMVDAPETVWVNDGAGNLTPHPTSPTFGTGDSLDVALGDLDGDGDLDAVVANVARDPETVWINDGAGSFTPHPTIPAFGADASFGVALGDLDGDGDLDAVVANIDVQAETVWVNDGTGGFTPHPTTPAFGADSSNNVSLGDLDGDGDLDAVVANGLEQPETVWVNDGTGSFTPHPTAPAFGAQTSSTAVLGDLDGDGDLDVVVATAFDEAETVWVNDGLGSFTPHPTTPAFGAGRSTDVALGDLDGDGNLDAVVANQGFQMDSVWLNFNDNTPPTTDDLSLSVQKDKSGAVLLTGSDADGDSLTYIIVTLPAHGTLTASGASLTYTPDHGYIGPDSFTFKVNDGAADSDTATVSINVARGGKKPPRK